MKAKVMIYTMVLLLALFTKSVWGGSEGSSNTLFGTGAGSNLGDDDDQATFIGYQAGYNTTDGGHPLDGKNNTFVGYRAGYSNTTGYSNTFLGSNAGNYNSTGERNTFIGGQAGSNNRTGAFNTFLGTLAGVTNTTGISNTFLGYAAGYTNTTGYSNTFLGYLAGYSNTTGSGNVFIGRNAGSIETGSNKLYIDNSDTSTPLIYGEFDTRNLTIHGNLEVIGPYQGLVYLSDNTADSNTKVSRMVLNHYSNSQLPVYLFGAASTSTNNFVAFGGGNTIGNAATQIDLFTAENTTTPVGTPRITIKGNGYVGIGTQSPSYPLHMAGGAYSNGVNWYNGSSRDYKDNIKSLKLEDAIETLNGLNPVTFNYKILPEENHVGFIAEEVPELIATKDRKGLSPMDIVAVLTKVVQEQQRTIEEQKKEYQRTISTLREELKELKEKVK